MAGRLKPVLLILLSVVCLLSLSGFNLASADTESTDSEIAETTDSKFKTGLGVGLQFGGLIGGQIGYVVDDHKTYVSVGAGALGVGYNYALSNDFSVGANFSLLIPGMAIAAGASVNVNYHFGTAHQNGWMVGFDIGRIDRLAGFDDESSMNIVFISGGYIF